MSDVLLLALGGLAVAGAMWLLDRVIDDNRIGISLILIIGIVVLAVPIPEPTIGGITITINDVVFVIVMSGIAARVLRGWTPTPMQLGVVVVLLLMLYSIARGAVEFGLAAAVNEARATLYFIAVILYATFLRPAPRTRHLIARLWLLYACGILAVAVYRWGVVFAGLPGRGSWFDPTYGGLRVIFSNDTLSLSIAFLILLPRVVRGEATRREWRMATAFGLAVIALQHRSVIAVLLAGVAAVLWRHRDRLSRPIVYGAGVACLVIGISLVTLLDGGQLAGQASSADAANTVTFEWRVAGWRVLLQDSGPASPEELLLGKPYGSGYERVLPTGQRVDVFPHNMYLELLLRIGLVGILAYVGMGVLMFRTLRRAPLTNPTARLDDPAMAVILIACALYMIPYNLFTEVGIIIGLAISAWGHPGSQDQPITEAPPYATPIEAVLERATTSPSRDGRLS